MNVDSVKRAVSQAVNKVQEAKAAPPPPAAAPAPAPAAPSSKSQVQSAFESAAKPKTVNLTGESSATAWSGKAASASSFRYVPGTTGLTTTPAGSSKAATASESVGTGLSHTESIEANKGFGVGFSFETTTSPVVTKPSKTGPESKVKVTATGSVYAYVEDEKKIGPVTVGGKAMVGVSTTYEAELPQDQYDTWVRNGANPAALPNPFDVEHMKPGAAVQIKSTSNEAVELQVAYRHIQAQTGNSHAKGTSQGVERLEGESPVKVRISAGPTEAVERTIGVGVGTKNFGVSLTGERGLESFNLQTAELNLSTPEGMAAYNNFLLTGQVPQQKGPGVEATARETKLSYTDALQAGLVVGDHEFSLNLNNVEQEIKITETDTERKIEFGHFSSADEGMSSVRSQNYYRDDSGQWALAPGGATQVTYSNVSDRDQARLQEIFTGQPGNANAGGRYNTQFTLSDDQANMLAQRARKYSKDNGLSVTSPTDVFIQQLSEARTPQEVQSAFNKARGNTTSVEALWVLYNHAADPMPLGSGYQQVKR